MPGRNERVKPGGECESDEAFFFLFSFHGSCSHRLKSDGGGTDH